MELNSKETALKKLLGYSSFRIFLAPNKFKYAIIGAFNRAFDEYDALYSYHHVTERLGIDDHFEDIPNFDSMTLHELLTVLYAIWAAERFEKFNGKLIRHLVMTHYIPRLMKAIGKQKEHINDEVPEEFFDRV